MRLALLVLLSAGCASEDASMPARPDATSAVDAAPLARADASDAMAPPADAPALPPIGDAPQWFVDAPEGQWIEVAAGSIRDDLPDAQRGERIIDVAPSPLPPGAEGVSAVTNDWTGGTALQARGEYVLPAQGGHNGYYGNEIYALALREATPSWRRIWGPTPNELISTSEHPLNAPYTAYADGSPRPVHGWFHVQASRADERIWLLATGANPSGTWTTETYSIARADLAAGWTYHGRLWTDIGGPSDFFYQSGPSAYDPVTRTIWKGAEASNISPFFVSFDVARVVAAGAQPPSGPLVTGANGYLGYGVGRLGNAWSAVVHGLGRRVWIMGAPAEERIAILDLDDPSAGVVKVAPSGAAPPGFGSHMGAVWLAASRAVVVGGLSGADQEDARLWKLEVPDDPVAGSYAWSEIVPAAGVVPTSSSQYRGTYSKLQLIEDMGNGQSAIVFVTDVRGPTYVYRVPAGGV